MAYHLHLVGSKTSHVGIQVPVYTDLSIRQSYGFARHPTIVFEDLGLSSAFCGAVTRLNTG